MYRDILKERRKEIFLDLLGIEPERIPNKAVVSSIEFDRIFRKDFLTLAKEKHRVVELKQEDKTLRRCSMNYLIEDTIFVYCGRGLSEFSDIFIVLCHSNVKRILFVGFCGGIREEINIGDVNVPTYILPIETDSLKISNKLPILDKKFSKFIVENIEGVKAFCKPHATLPFFFLETKELLEYLKEFNIWTIDAELSAFARITREFNKKAAAILIVTDKPLERKGFYDEEYKKEKEKWKRAGYLVFRFILEKFVSK